MPDRYFLIDLILTFLLLSLVILLVKGALFILWLYLILILICGFCFSWLFKDTQSRFIKFFATASACAILTWMVSSILNSSFLYKDVILICIKAVLFLEAMLSFSAFLPKHLAYMQALSVPLFMCFPLVTKDSNEVAIVWVLGYFICWLAIFKVKFYELLKRPVSEITLGRDDSAVLLTIIFVIILSISGTLFFRYPFKQIIKGGFFFEKGSDTLSLRDTIEKEYYDLQEEMQKKITELIPGFGWSQDRYSALTLLSYLLKDSSTVMEVERAFEGLVSYLKTPGLGLEKGEQEEVEALLRKFMNEKIAFNLRVIAGQVLNMFKRSPFHIRERIAIAQLVEKIQRSESISQITEHQKQLQGFIDNSSLGAGIKKELKELVWQIKEWKALQLQQQRRHFAGGSLVTLAPEQQQQLLLEKYLKAQTTIPNFNVAIIDSLTGIIIKTMLILLLCIPILFFILYFLTSRRKDKLLSLYQDPREFIINLYGNLKNVLIIFGPRYNEVMPPLSYAELVEKKYSIEDNVFSRFTAKFEEAKYSQHHLGSTDALRALNDYNDFLKILFSSQNKFKFLLRYCLTLLYRKPLSIYGELAAC